MWPFSNRKREVALAMRDACERLWRGDGQQAARDFAAMGERFGRQAVYSAYESLAWRMAGDVQRAVDAADAALAQDRLSLEACFARSVAELRLKDGPMRSIVGRYDRRSPGLLDRCMMNWNAMREAAPFNHEGHFLNVLGFVLFREAGAGMRERGDSLELRFEHTPAVRVAFLVLDGAPGRALTETPPSDGGLAQDTFGLARALAGYRLDDEPAMRTLIGIALDQEDQPPPSIAASVRELFTQYMLRKAKRDLT